MEDIADVLEDSAVCRDLVARALETNILRQRADSESRTALRYLHKVIESERKGRTEEYMLEAYVDEFNLAIELGLLEKGPEARRADRVVHYISSTPYGQDVYIDLEGRGYVFDAFEESFRKYLDSQKTPQT
jgi:hypothetical protein